MPAKSATTARRSWCARRFFPWLDQIALPLVIHSLGGGRPGPGLAGHGRRGHLPLPHPAAALRKESDQAVTVLEALAEVKENRRILRDWAPVKQMVYQNGGKRARALFDRSDLPHREQAIRNTLKREGLWVR